MNTADNLVRHYVFSADFLHSFCWDEECAVYHAESGDTHLLSKAELCVLHYINGTPGSAEDLIKEFESVFGDGAVEYIPSLLSNFAELGLVEAVNNESPH